MNRKLVIGGSVGAVVLIALTICPAVVSAEILSQDGPVFITSRGMQQNGYLRLFQNLKENNEYSEWFPGYFILKILDVLGLIWGQIIDWLISGFYP